MRRHAEPIHDDYIAALAVVTALLVGELDDFASRPLNTRPAGLGLASWWLGSLAYASMVASLATAVAASYMEVVRDQLPPVVVPTLLFAAGFLMDVASRLLRFVIAFGAYAVAPDTDDEVGEGSLIDESSRSAFLVGAVVPLVGLLVATPIGVALMLSTGGRPVRAPEEAHTMLPHVPMGLRRR